MMMLKHFFLLTETALIAFDRKLHHGWLGTAGYYGGCLIEGMAWARREDQAAWYMT